MAERLRKLWRAYDARHTRRRDDPTLVLEHIGDDAATGEPLWCVEEVAGGAPCLLPSQWMALALVLGDLGQVARLPDAPRRQYEDDSDDDDLG